ncbi:MAG: hypothetical protein AAF135_00215 [Bacteroidota bacterium]
MRLLFLYPYPDQVIDTAMVGTLARGDLLTGKLQKNDEEVRFTLLLTQDLGSCTIPAIFQPH